MSGRAAVSEMAAPRLLVIEGETAHDVFELLGITDGVARVRAAYLFEIGEELTVRVEEDGTAKVLTARVRAHLGPVDAQITELELS